MSLRLVSTVLTHAKRRTLSATKRNYAHIEKEGLRMVFGVTYIHGCLYGHELTLVTDHKSLLGLFREYRPIPLWQAAALNDEPEIVELWTLAQVSTWKDNDNVDGHSHLPLPANLSEPSQLATWSCHWTWLIAHQWHHKMSHNGQAKVCWCCCS